MSDALLPKQIEFVDRFIGGRRPVSTESVQQDQAPDLDVSALADLFLDGKSRATSSIAPLRAILVKSDDPDERRIGEHGLDGVTEGNSVALITALHQLRAAPATERTAAAQIVATRCQQYRDFLKNDAIIALCEDNPFVSGVSIAAPLTTALDQIEATLKAI